MVHDMLQQHRPQLDQILQAYLLPIELEFLLEELRSEEVNLCQIRNYTFPGLAGWLGRYVLLEIRQIQDLVRHPPGFLALLELCQKGIGFLNDRLTGFPS